MTDYLSTELGRALREIANNIHDVAVMLPQSQRAPIHLALVDLYLISNKAFDLKKEQ